MSFVLRTPELPDAAEIADLHVQTWREAYADLLPEDFFDEAHIEGRHTFWSRVLSDPKDEWTIRIAESGGSIVGFGFSGPSIAADGQDLPRDRQLYAIYVASAHYGRGIGQALLDASLGEGAAMLWVAKDNPRAIAFYRRNGFEFDGVEQQDPGAPKIVDARMVR